jgi:hypothetical protein
MQIRSLTLFETSVKSSEAFAVFLLDKKMDLKYRGTEFPNMLSEILGPLHCIRKGLEFIYYRYEIYKLMYK